MSDWCNCSKSRLQMNCPVFSLTSHSCPPLFRLTWPRDREDHLPPPPQGSLLLSGCIFLSLSSLSLFLLLLFSSRILGCIWFLPFISFTLKGLLPLVILFLYAMISWKNRAWNMCSVHRFEPGDHSAIS